MALLTKKQREEIIRRRGPKSDKTGKKGRIDYLDPRNLRVLTKKEHDDLHRRSG